MPRKQSMEYSLGRYFCEQLYAKGSPFLPIEGGVQLLLHILTVVAKDSSKGGYDCYLRKRNRP
jgi:hypothetical protein